MTTEEVAIDRQAMNKATKKGLIAAMWLAILTLIEYGIFAWTGGGVLYLLPFVFLKGWIILDSFMHVKALWGDDH